MDLINSQLKRLVGKPLLIPGILLVACLVFFLTTDLMAQECTDGVHVECRGGRNIEYMVKDINNLERPYSYVIGSFKYSILEVIGILAALGAIGFAALHGFGRYLANKKNPVALILKNKVFIYKLIIRIGHLFNAIAVLVLLFTGFVMHYSGPLHSLGLAHNIAGIAFVAFWIIFFVYEITSFDVKQFIVQDWELKEGILKQALFYAFGIFKQEEHPYHMKATARLNPLQKVAYFGVMFFLVPFMAFTGMVLLKPDIMSFFVNYIGMENMKYVFIAHVAGGFAMLAYLLGHLYLGTTGDKILQHYKVIVTGYHDEYQRKTVDAIPK